ncbi:papain-like cysteine protease family protein [Fulvivirga ligni]|uniref:papain-like cysteine protease family protein n=1 Tax=Fulvivirga ligni TaxID=2904246 RepID=UPI001F3843A3|nr:papain-like cysteine protease family protein [Fulvivirga ligni]UII21549.1 cysteine peptidase family C39 domain-containing protein [Fulvivirga ligni]
MIAEKIRLPFQLELQKGERMCWAAVSVAIAKYYGHQSIQDQIAFARSIMGEHYDQFCAMDKALMTYGHLKQILTTPLSKEQIDLELHHKQPIIACMKYFVGWHVVVIYGIENDHLLIADPLHGYSKWRLSTFTTSYQEYYSWSHSYKTCSKGEY